MKKILGLLLLIPLTTIAAEHAGKPMHKKAQAQGSSEHAGKAMEKRKSGKSAEHAGKPAEHAGKPAEHAGKPADHAEESLKKEATEPADTPVE